MPSPAPPYSSGIRAASHPASLSVLTNSSGYAFFSSHARQYSLPNRAHNTATAARISFWLSDNSKSMNLLRRTHTMADLETILHFQHRNRINRSAVLPSRLPLFVESADPFQSIFAADQDVVS